MTKIFWGLLFIFLNFNIEIYYLKISFIPDFIGYILIYQGLTEFKQESGYFEKARPFAIVLSVLMGINFIMDFIGISATHWILSQALVLPVLFIDIYVMYCIITGIGEMEHNEHDDYNADKLKSLWLTTVILEIVTVVASYMTLYVRFGAYTTLLMIMTGTTIASFVVYIIFLVHFNTARKRIEYENYNG